MDNSVTDQELAKNNMQLRKRVLDYCIYLYEEEKQRTERLEKKVNVFSVALGGSFLTVLYKIPIGIIPSVFDSTKLQGLIIIILFSIALILFISSSIFTYLVYKVRDFERLNDPKSMAIKSDTMKDEVELIAEMIADYTVATNKNNLINNKKARQLSNALLCLLGAALLTILTLILINLIMTGRGG